MIDFNSQNEWQYRDPSNGLIYPWYTKPALDEIATWDLKDKIVFEYGCGASTLWWVDKAKKVYGVENDKVYFDVVAQKVGDKASICHEPEAEPYINSIRQWGIKFDIIVVDGGWRDESIPTVLEHLKPGGILIYDNWMQPQVCIQTEEVQRTLLAMPHKIYKEAAHKYWQTLIAWNRH
jgi:SAM-dependent methyltransferase